MASAALCGYNCNPPKALDEDWSLCQNCGEESKVGDGTMLSNAEEYVFA